ncbi:MAG: PEGA domain-containing protein [Myxococcota bacterium]
MRSLALARIRIAATCLLAVVWLSQASAQTAADRETARRLMDRGDEQVQRGDLAAALTFYRGAHEIMHVPTTGIEIARTLAALGQLAEARDAALEVLRMPARAAEPTPFAEARAQAEQMAGELAAKIPTLTVSAPQLEKISGATLDIDGNEVPRAAIGLPQSLNPGKHRVRLSAPGYVPVEKSVTLVANDHQSLRIELEALSPALATAPAPASPFTAPPERLSSPPPSSARASSRLGWPFWAGAAVGGAGLVTGGLAGVVSLKRAHDAREQCDGNVCPEAARSDRDASLAAAWVSNVGFACALLGAGVSVGSWLLSNADEPRKAQPASWTVTSVAGGGVITWRGSLE